MDVWDISYGTVGACHMWKNFFFVLGGGTLDGTMWGETDMGGRHSSNGGWGVSDSMKNDNFIYKL